MSSRLSVGKDFPKNSSRSHIFIFLCTDLPAQFIVEDNVHTYIFCSGRNCTCVDFILKKYIDGQNHAFVP